VNPQRDGWRTWLSVILLAVGMCARGMAQDLPGSLLQVDSVRAGVKIPVFLHASTGAHTTLVLLPGGAGGIGKVGFDGWPEGGNFLIRSGKLFASQGFNLAMVARPSDQSDMDYPFRMGTNHMDDLERVLRHVRKTWVGPVWLVGTSRGTVSATAAAIALKDAGLIDGVVLTSSVVRLRVTGAVPTQELSAIRVPVLVLHHSQDACRFCLPQDVPPVLSGLTHAGARALLWVDAGEGVSGDPCEAQHYHGFKGAESMAVQMIADWIRQPHN
jgi:hypothetical protein